MFKVALMLVNMIESSLCLALVSLHMLDAIRKFLREDSILVLDLNLSSFTLHNNKCT